jgi:hypothetical protein
MVDEPTPGETIWLAEIEPEIAPPSKTAIKATADGGMFPTEMKRL